MTSESRPARLARRIFLWSGVYGIIVLAPQFLLEAKNGRDFPPPINHPEFYYGFNGVALAFQVLFLIIARDPVRYRLAMIPSVLEKVAFGGAVCILYAHGRVAPFLLVPASIDLALAALFLLAFRLTPRDQLVVYSADRV